MSSAANTDCSHGCHRPSYLGGRVGVRKRSSAKLYDNSLIAYPEVGRKRRLGKATRCPRGPVRRYSPVGHSHSSRSRGRRWRHGTGGRSGSGRSCSANSSSGLKSRGRGKARAGGGSLTTMLIRAPTTIKISPVDCQLRRRSLHKVLVVRPWLRTLPQSESRRFCANAASSRLSIGAGLLP
jgi:hypothetical protein